MCQTGALSKLQTVSHKDIDQSMSEEEVLALAQPQHTKDEIANYNSSEDKLLSILLQTLCTAMEEGHREEQDVIQELMQ